MEPTTILSSEHRVIETVLNCLEQMTAQAIEQDRLDGEAAAKAVDFIRNFADKCHHGKEEDILFRAMVDAGMPSDGGPIAVMLSDHEQGRAFVRGMDEAIPQAAAGDAAAVQRFAAHARGYVALLRAHIQKEDHVLFPMADRLLALEEQTILEKFNTVEHDHMGEGTHERYLALAVELADKYGVNKKHVTGAVCGCNHGHK